MVRLCTADGQKYYHTYMHACMHIGSLSNARLNVGPTYWPTSGWDAGGFEDLHGPLLCTKSQPHLTIWMLSSRAHKYISFGWDVQSIQWCSVHLDLCKPDGTSDYRREVFWVHLNGHQVGPTTGVHYEHRAHRIISIYWGIFKNFHLWGALHNSRAFLRRKPS